MTFKTMSVGGTFLIVVTATFLKPLLCTNQSLQQPSVTVYDKYIGVSPSEENGIESDDVSKFLTFHLPQLMATAKNADLDMKRQFDPWGGKRQSKSLAKEGDIGRKRQFSPWGGKRSTSLNHPLYMDDNDFTYENNQMILPGNKRNFNSWGGKRNVNTLEERGRFNSWGGKRRFNSWGGKKRFNAWGGKRFMEEQKEDFDNISYIPRNINVGNKRQGFNSWGGKRTFNSWGGKRANAVEPKNEFKNSDDKLIS